MLGKYRHKNFSDENGNPAGGFAEGVGIDIRWQNGPLGTGENRIEPNGAFVETLLSIVADRIEFYQSSRFACPENERALGHVWAAICALQERTKKRDAAGVEGTHETIPGEGS